MIEALKLACQVCESSSALEQHKHVIFLDGTLRVFNGLVSFAAPSDLPTEAKFALNEAKLLVALSACEGEELQISNSNASFLIFKNGPLTVRVRKLDAEQFYDVAIAVPVKKDRTAAGNLHEALKIVAPFVSEDATRPWSMSVMLGKGFAWATNNLSLVRYPIDVVLDGRIPGNAIPLLCTLPAIDWIHFTDTLCYIGSGSGVVAVPQSAAEWPDVMRFFADKPKKLPRLDENLLAAAKTVEKFADRFITLTDASIEGKSATIESEYEIEVKRGKGTYSARLLSLIAAHATHGDFSTYPKPVYFGNANGLQGTAVGLPPSAAPATAPPGE